MIQKQQQMKHLHYHNYTRMRTQRKDLIR